MEELGIYIHIPFCKQKCYYCDFVSYPNRYEMVERYIKCLKSEIAQYANENRIMHEHGLEPKFIIKTIYIGGGTPSSIDEFYILNVMETIKANFEIDEEAVLKEANGKNPWFVMCTHMFNDPRYQDIPDFKDYIPGGKRSDPAPVNFFWDKCQYGSDLFVYVPMPDFVESVQKIHEAGGLAIVAHPFNTFYKNDEMFKVLLDAGVDGIEAYSNYHTPEQNVYYEKLAKEHHLLITCGSDFHGEKKPSIQMGEYGLDKDGSLWLEQFKEKLKAAREY